MRALASVSPCAAPRNHSSRSAVDTHRHNTRTRSRSSPTASSMSRTGTIDPRRTAHTASPRWTTAGGVQTEMAVWIVMAGCRGTCRTRSGSRRTPGIAAAGQCTSPICRNRTRRRRSPRQAHTPVLQQAVGAGQTRGRRRGGATWRGGLVCRRETDAKPILHAGTQTRVRPVGARRPRPQLRTDTAAQPVTIRPTGGDSRGGWDNIVPTSGQRTSAGAQTGNGANGSRRTNCETHYCALWREGEGRRDESGGRLIRDRAMRPWGCLTSRRLARSPKPCTPPHNRPL